MKPAYDHCVVGGGIVGLSVAMQILQRQPGSRLALLEKERSLASHQTAHNSGVIHSGIYYEPGSLKASLCRQGAVATKHFASEHGIAVQVCGKLIVATSSRELALLEALAVRADLNGIEAKTLESTDISKWEPAIRGVGALYVGSTAIVDYGAIAATMADIVRDLGGEIALGVEVDSIDETPDGVRIGAGQQVWTTERLTACAGLQSDRIARLAGLEPDFRIIPFRGEYYRLAMKDFIRHLVYPVPDPELPFLGVHLTLTTDGTVTVGPNAVLALAREGYEKFSFNAKDAREIAAFPGMWRLARNNIRTGLKEVTDSFFKPGYLARCRKFCPSLRLGDLLPHAAGIRAQAVKRDGSLVHDFLFLESNRMLHVCNAPSPAATSALPIGREIVDRLL
jgi:L-2-hydroxyglutarate oxidase